MLHGSCLCGGIRYQLDAPLGPIVLCHCSMCRKAQGSAFAANSAVPAAAFRLLEGAHLIASYRSSPGKQRCFCSVCGSPIFSRRDAQPEVLRLRIGTLDTPSSDRPAAHIFVASKAEWEEIHDSLPQHAGLEPGR